MCIKNFHGSILAQTSTEKEPKSYLDSVLLIFILFKNQNYPTDKVTL
ncbi:hypothetical protein HMPREF9176_0305 [Streptococcus downei F0415]|nr:hypothetical protein HMPREF9176_0305 [Streptococcus downei F0415]